MACFPELNVLGEISADRTISGAKMTNSRFQYSQQTDFLNPQRMDYHRNLPCLSFPPIIGSKTRFSASNPGRSI